MDTQRIGFLGAGNMAGALIKGLLGSGKVTKDRILASDVREERLADLAKEYGIRTTQDNAALMAECTVIVLSVKPQVVDRVLVAHGAALRPEAVLVSIAAGVSLDAMESRLPAGARVIRTMPNTAATALAADTWTTAKYTGDEIGPRDGAAWLVDASLERVLVFGGGERRDVAQIDLVAGADGSYAAEVLGTDLDGPRRGATALFLVRTDTDEGEGVVLVGGDDPARPLAWSVATREGVGPAEAWTGLQCAQLDLAAGADDEVRVLCLGGLRGGAATTAALVLHFPAASADKPPTLEILPDLVQGAPVEPRLFVDETSVYAQFAGPEGGVWLRIARSDLSPTVSFSPALRARGGHSVLLATGATFLLGGWTADEHAVDRWHVFVPALATE